jgi:ABC-type transport system substrate-binding protein
MRAGALTPLGLATLRCASAPSAAPAAPGGTSAGATVGPMATGGAASPTIPAAKYGGVLRVGVSDIAQTHLDFQQPGGGSSGAWSYAIAYSGLLKFKHGQDIKPPAWIPTGDVAESWEQADDLTYIFRLRRGVKFQNIAPVNGREVVAEDFVFSFKRQIDMRLSAALLANVVKMEAPDKYTLKLTLDRPNADLLINLSEDACKVIAREAVELKGDLKEGPVIGTGPWILEKYEFGQYDYLVRNPDYFLKGLPYLDRIELIHQATPRNMSAIQAGAIDVHGVALLAPDFEAAMKPAPQLKAHTLLDTRNGHELGFNTARPPFADLRLRQATLKALDFQTAIDTVVLGRGDLTSGVVLPDEAWKLPKDELQRLFRRDVDGARRLLREASMEQGFEADCMFIPVFSSGAFQTYSELFQQQLREVGIRLNLKPLEPAAFGGLAERGEFHMYVDTQRGQASANGDLLGRYHSKGPTNYMKYSDPKMDDLIEKQAALSRDPEGRKNLLQEIQRYVIDRAFKVGITSPLVGMPYAPYVKNWWPAQHSTKAGDHWTDVWVDR